MVVYAFASLEAGVNKDTLEIIRQLAIKTGALQFGDFTLASGLESKYYFDGKMLTSDPEGAHLVGQAVLDALRGYEVDAIGGLEIGAIPAATAASVLSYEQKRPITSFIVRKAAKAHGTGKRVEGQFRPGMRVAIVDDVITTGDSVKEAIRIAEEMGCKVVKVIVLADRHQGGSDDLKNAGYNFAALLDILPSGEARVGESSRFEGVAG